MITVPKPLLLNRYDIAELPKKGRARHNAASEKVLCDPISCVGCIEAVGSAAMIEYMNKNNPVWLGPVRNSLQKRRPVGHMLEHFNRHHAIETTQRRKNIHFRNFDSKIAAVFTLGVSQDRQAL
jgi:hypothetical protein